MDDDKGIQYYNDNLDLIGKWPRYLGTEWPLTFPVVWWKASVKKQSRISTASGSLKHNVSLVSH